MDMFSYLLGRNSGGGKGSLKVVVVEELPETGEANTLYLVPRQVSETNNVFDEYLYVDEDWEKVGTTDIDISGKQDTFQFSTLPTANASNVGKIVQYTGTTNANYTNGYFYVCLSDGGDPATYSWANLEVQENEKAYEIEASGTTIPSQYDTVLQSFLDDYFAGKSPRLILKRSGLTYFATSVYNDYNAIQITFSNSPSSESGLYVSERSGGTISLSLNYDTSTYTMTGKRLQIETYYVLARNHQFLTTNNTQAFTPTGDYNPATKKYVDDAVASAGGTSDYTELTNKPSINGVTLSGNKTSEDLGIGSSDGIVITTQNRTDSEIISAVNAEYQKAKELKPYSNIYAVYIPSAGSQKIVPLRFDISSSSVTLRSDYFDRNFGTDHFGKLTISLTRTNDEITAIDTIGYTGFETAGASQGTIIMATGNQYISGKKTFGTLPESSVTPTTAEQLTNKKYVDDLVGNINTVLATLTTPSNNGGN